MVVAVGKMYYLAQVFHVVAIISRLQSGTQLSIFSVPNVFLRKAQNFVCIPFLNKSHL